MPRASTQFGLVLLIAAVAVPLAFIDFGGDVSGKPAAEFVRLAAMLAVFALAANLFATPGRVRAVFALVGLGGVIPASIGIGQWIGGVAPVAGLNVSRIGGTFNGPNPFGMYLAVCALILLAAPRRTIPVWVKIPAIEIMLVALVGTYSRAGWALFLVGFALIEWRRRKGAVLAAAVVVVGIVLLVPSVHHRILPTSSSESSSVTTPESYVWRLGNWNGLIDEWAKRPVYGYGLATTAFVNPRKLSNGNGHKGYEAHNGVLNLLVEGGVLLLVAVVALVVAIMRSLRSMGRARWYLSRSAQALTSIWTAIVVIAFLTDDPLASTRDDVRPSGGHGRPRGGPEARGARAAVRLGGPNASPPERVPASMVPSPNGSTSAVQT